MSIPVSMSCISVSAGNFDKIMDSKIIFLGSCCGVSMSAECRFPFGYAHALRLAVLSGLPHGLPSLLVPVLHPMILLSMILPIIEKIVDPVMWDSFSLRPQFSI